MNKTYMRELKKGDTMHQALQKVKSLVASLLKQACQDCQQTQELADLQRIVRERVFEASNEVETTLDNIEVSVPTKVSYTRGQQAPLAVVRSRVKSQLPDQGSLTQPRHRETGSVALQAFGSFGGKSAFTNQLSHIIPEEELDTEGQPPMIPFYDVVIQSNKMSAIGLPEFARKDSPFWDGGENIFEL